MIAEPLPLVLDFDGSVLPVAEAELRLPLRDWQEEIRFGTTEAGYARLEEHLRGCMPKAYGCVFTGSGDFHHVSLLLLRRIIARRRLAPGSLDVVVCDNHPDNMRYIFGLHCGSWVRRAAALPAVRHVHVVGITSGDIAAGRAWENYLGPFIGRKLTYWSVGVSADWLKLLGRREHGRSFASADALLDAFLPVLHRAGHIYLSIDKDALSPDVVRTNWDQGVFAASHLETLITACADRLCGADVCGDISSYRYTSALKRFLAGLDGQDNAAPANDMHTAQKAQQAVNRALAALLRLEARQAQGM